MLCCVEKLENKMRSSEPGKKKAEIKGKFDHSQ